MGPPRGSKRTSKVLLDRTAIVIAQRSADELFDLSLIVIRTFWHRLIPMALMGILPFAIVNFLLLWPMTQYEQLVMASADFATVEGYRARYLWSMVCMVFLESPLAMCGVTFFLGQAVFIEQPSMRQVVSAVASRWFALLLIIGLLRGGVLGIAWAVWLAVDPLMNTEWYPIVMSLLAAIVFFLIRSVRPFAPEILLLERCPLVRRKSESSAEQSYGKRSAWLHASSGDLFSIQIGIAFISFVFILATLMASLFFVGVLIGVWTWGWWMDLIFFPMALWMMVVWESVIRLLLYLNTRIRTEGWEVYLSLKAELQKLQETP